MDLEPKLAVEKYIKHIYDGDYSAASELLLHRGKNIDLAREIKDNYFDKYFSKLTLDQAFVNQSKAHVKAIGEDGIVLFFNLTYKNSNWLLDNPVPLHSDIYSFRVFAVSENADWHVKRTITVKKKNDEYEIDRTLVFKYIGPEILKNYMFESSAKETNYPNSYLIDFNPREEHITGTTLTQPNPFKVNDVINEIINYSIIFTWGENRSTLFFNETPCYVIYNPFQNMTRGRGY